MSKLNRILYGLKLGKYGIYGVREVKKDDIICTDFNITMLDNVTSVVIDST